MRRLRARLGAETTCLGYTVRRARAIVRVPRVPRVPEFRVPKQHTSRVAGGWSRRLVPARSCERAPSRSFRRECTHGGPASAEAAICALSGKRGGGRGSGDYSTATTVSYRPYRRSPGCESIPVVHDSETSSTVCPGDRFEQVRLEFGDDGSGRGVSALLSPRKSPRVYRTQPRATTWEADSGLGELANSTAKSPMGLRSLAALLLYRSCIRLSIPVCSPHAAPTTSIYRPSQQDSRNYLLWCAMLDHGPATRPPDSNGVDLSGAFGAR